MHPEDTQHCIKIVYYRGNDDDKEIRRELEYCAHLSRRLKDWSRTSRYHGTVETDCGTGYVYDVIADFGGKPPTTLIEFAEQYRYEKDIAQLRQLLKQLKHYLQDNRVVTMSLKPQNILRRRISESEVIPVVCDNTGEGILIPPAIWSKWCRLHKQERLRRRFIAQPVLAIALQEDLQSRESKTLVLTSCEA